MFFVSKLIIALISPLGTSLLLGLVALGLAFTHWRRCAFVIGGAGILWLGVWSLPVASGWLFEQLETDFPFVAVQSLPEKQAMVVLGGGMVPAVDEMVFPRLQSGADRIWHAARIYHAGKAPLIVLSGGRPSLTRQSEAQAMQIFLLDLGVAEQALVLEEESANTRENAENSARILSDLDITDILLVTSAFHMPRAKALFEAQGLKVTPASTDYQAIHTPGWRGWVPSTKALDISSRAIKELVGRIAGH